MLAHLRRGRRAALLVLLACLALAAPCAARAQDADPLRAELARALDLAGRDPRATRALITQLRNGAIAAQRLDMRLLADELDCRVLSDLDADAAEKVAAEGVAAAARHPAVLDPATNSALLRLRACLAGVQIDLGKLTSDQSALTQIMEQAAGPALESARAMAQLERGLHRSRQGELIAGQADLLAACATLHRLARGRDEDLCLGHLANHYKRMGDFAEALRLLERLERAAAAHGADADRAVYAFAIGQVHATEEKWSEALAAFEDAVQLNRALDDESGEAYALEGAAEALMKIGRTAEALPRIERATAMFARLNDPLQLLSSRVLYAQALQALDEPMRAAAALADVREAVERTGTDFHKHNWLEADAAVQARLGHFQRAYESLDRARTIGKRLNAQRLSQNAARLRMQFNRELDAAELHTLQRLAAQADQLRATQAMALALSIVLAVALLVFAVRKVRQSRRLQQLASTDELTGAMNRRAVMTFADTALARAAEDHAPMSVLLVDVDHFKRINDQYGHAAGDRVLVALTRRLHAALRGSDRIGRIGGEEFLAVLPNTPAGYAAQIAERMRLACAQEPVPGPNGALPFTVSIGTSTATGATPLAALIEQADTALYAAKSAGRNAVIAFTPELAQAAARAAPPPA